MELDLERTEGIKVTEGERREEGRRETEEREGIGQTFSGWLVPVRSERLRAHCTPLGSR
jgi:hypothetical protein